MIMNKPTRKIIIELMKTNYEKFYEKEQPELVIIRGNELRLFRENMRLAVSKPFPYWADFFKDRVKSIDDNFH